MDADTLLRDYLMRLEAAAWPLGEARRSELLGEVREHIESALAEAGKRDEVTARNILDRLGAPEEIVAAEVGSENEGTARLAGPLMVEVRTGWGFAEVAAIALLTVGAVFLPIVGPLIGLVFVWGSAQWTTRQKWVASAIVVVLLLLPVLFLLGVDVTSGSVSGPY